jgi:hypothetical protein
MRVKRKCSQPNCERTCKEMCRNHCCQVCCWEKVQISVDDMRCPAHQKDFEKLAKKQPNKQILINHNDDTLDTVHEALNSPASPNDRTLFDKIPNLPQSPVLTQISHLNHKLTSTPALNGSYISYKCSCKALLVGFGADEQMAGYSRHRTAFRNGGVEGLESEMNVDLERLWKRNLGRFVQPSDDVDDNNNNDDDDDDDDDNDDDNDT